MNPKLILITGFPCTGKTTLAQKVEATFSIPRLSKDDIKESLFDSLGWSDRERSRQLGKATYPLLFSFLESLLKTGTNCVIESNFKPEFDSAVFQKFQKSYQFECLQILCHCDGEILFERFKQRAENGERHPGHVDHTALDEFKPLLLQGKIEPIKIDGETIEIDNTDFEQVDDERILERIKKFLDHEK